MLPTFYKARSSVANAALRGIPDDSPEMIALRQRMRAARLAEVVTAALNSQPPITDEDRFEIAGMLLSWRGDAA